MKIWPIIIAITLCACGNLSKNENVFQAEKLKGKYKVDLSPFIADAVKSGDSNDELGNLGKGLAGLALSSVNIEMSFYDNNKGIMQMEGGLIDLSNAFSDKPIEKIHEFSYKVVDDSVLCMKGKDETEYQKWAIVKKYSESYDYLKFLIVEEGEDTVYFNLTRIKE